MRWIAAAAALAAITVVLLGFERLEQRVPTAEAGGPEMSQCLRAAAGSSARREKVIADCIKGEKMSKRARNCLFAAGITTGGVVVGGVIGGAAARAIAGGVVGGGGTACLMELT